MHIQNIPSFFIFYFFVNWMHAPRMTSKYFIYGTFLGGYVLRDGKLYFDLPENFDNSKLNFSLMSRIAYRNL